MKTNCEEKLDDALRAVSRLLNELKVFPSRNRPRRLRLVEQAMVSLETAKLLAPRDERSPGAMPFYTSTRVVAKRDADDEQTAQSYELTIAAFRGALMAAVVELDEHNNEYGHRTPKAKIEAWRKLASGDSMVEVIASLDATETEVQLFHVARGSGSEYMSRVSARELSMEEIMMLTKKCRQDELSREQPVELLRWEDDGGYALGDGVTNND
jgi:hypothetical protein